jgi:hypothetical protein
MQVLGHFARVSLEAIRSKIKFVPHAFDGMLGPSEREAIGHCVTLKRWTEFIGGRLAAKLAFLADTNKYTSSCSLLSLVDIPPSEASAPQIYYQGMPVGSVSISHSGRWAVGLFSSRGRVALDIEDSDWHGAANQDYFSKYELPHIKDEYDARVRWTVKECCFKLVNVPGFDLIENAITICHDSQKWVATSYSGVLRGVSLGIFKWGTLAVSAGFAEPTQEGPNPGPMLKPLHTGG